MREDAKREIVALLGEDGLALAAAAGDLTAKLADGVPDRYAVVVEVDKTDSPWEGRVTIRRARCGDVDFILYHRDGEFEIVPVGARPDPIRL